LCLFAAGLTHRDLRAKVRREGRLVILLDGELAHLTLLGIAHCGVDHYEVSERDSYPGEGGKAGWQGHKEKKRSLTFLCNCCHAVYF
jgi:hypothetical protein